MRRFPYPLVLAVLLSALAWAGRASADCGTDIDCLGATCGSAVCQYTVGGSNCVAAGTDVQGIDGTCRVDSDCKCAGEGATCAAGLGHCTFTLPQDAGSASADAASSSDGSDSQASCRISRMGPCDSMMIAAAYVMGLVLARRRRAPRA
jgi:hypothetical protein